MWLEWATRPQGSSDWLIGYQLRTTETDKVSRQLQDNRGCEEHHRCAEQAIGNDRETTSNTKHVEKIYQIVYIFCWDNKNWTYWTSVECSCCYCVAPSVRQFSLFTVCSSYLIYCIFKLIECFLVISSLKGDFAPFFKLLTLFLEYLQPFLSQCLYMLLFQRHSLDSSFRRHKPFYSGLIDPRSSNVITGQVGLDRPVPLLIELSQVGCTSSIVPGWEHWWAIHKIEFITQQMMNFRPCSAVNGSLFVPHIDFILMPFQSRPALPFAGMLRVVRVHSSESPAYLLIEQFGEQQVLLQTP